MAQIFSQHFLPILVILSMLMNSCSNQTRDPITISDTNVGNPSGANSMEVIEKTLENGLTVYLSPNHEEPRFYAEIITRAGSKHDPATNTGLAHYLEHLLFKGTQSFGTLDFEKEKPLLDQITKLYEQRSQETNESKGQIFIRKLIGFQLKLLSLRFPMKWIAYTAIWAERGSTLILGMRKRCTKWIFHQTDWNTGQKLKVRDSPSQSFVFFTLSWKPCMRKKTEPSIIKTDYCTGR